MDHDSRIKPIRSTPALPRPSPSRWKKSLALAALLCVPAVCFARELSMRECVEGGDFIKNAALARDGGMSEARFIDRLHEDLEIIRAFPPHMRWFVQDEDDAKFLLAAATEVFRKPRQARLHQADFFKACLAKTDGKSSKPL